MNKDQLIANYFSHTLSDEDTQRFNHLLETDSEFKAQVDFEARVKKAIHKKEHEKLKQRFQNLDNSLENAPKKGNTKVWFVAASIAIISALTYTFIYFNKDYSSQELYASYYQPAKNVVQPIVRNGGSQTDKVEAFIAYQKEDYKTAKHMFSNLYVSTKDSELLFYEGISLLELNEVDKAISKFTSHLNYNDAVSDMTHWYLALAYLKGNDTKNAKTILTKIVDDTNSTFKKEEAKALLNKL